MEGTIGEMVATIFSIVTQVEPITYPKVFSNPEMSDRDSNITGQVTGNSDEDSINSGIAYLLKNEAMPGLVKIRKTIRSDTQLRVDEFYNSSVPVPFECVLAMLVDYPSSVELALHTAFGPQRVNLKREFFKIDAEQALAILRIIGSEDVTPAVNEINNTISEMERATSEELRRRRPNLNFSEMGIAPGCVFDSVNGEETATVVDDRKVSFRNQAMLLTGATRVCRDLSYNVNPCPYWLYSGRRLSDIYEEAYNLDDY